MRPPSIARKSGRLSLESLPASAGVSSEMRQFGNLFRTLPPAGFLAHERLRGPSCSARVRIWLKWSALPEVALPSSPEMPTASGEDLFERRRDDRGGPA